MMDFGSHLVFGDPLGYGVDVDMVEFIVLERKFAREAKNVFGLVPSDDDASLTNCHGPMIYVLL